MEYLEELENILHEFSSMALKTGGLALKTASTPQQGGGGNVRQNLNNLDGLLRSINNILGLLSENYAQPREVVLSYLPELLKSEKEDDRFLLFELAKLIKEYKGQYRRALDEADNPDKEEAAGLFGHLEELLGIYSGLYPECIKIFNGMREFVAVSKGKVGLAGIDKIGATMPEDMGGVKAVKDRSRLKLLHE